MGRGRFDLIGDRAPLPFLARQQRSELCFLGREPVDLLADLDLLEPAQSPQPHIEDRLGLDLGQIPAGHHLGLRVVAFTDDPDHLVEIDIDDDLPAQNLHAAGNRREAVAALALQHYPAVVEKGLQRLLQVHHPGDAERVEHIEVERHPDFELGQPEKLLHQHLGLDVARLGFENEPYVLGQFVADVGEQRQLLFFE